MLAPEGTTSPVQFNVPPVTPQVAPFGSVAETNVAPDNKLVSVTPVAF